jgi:hypothetical protein
MRELGFEPMIRVRSCQDRSDDAFAVVRYKGRWFWVDHDDFASKRTLGLM